MHSMHPDVPRSVKKKANSLVLQALKTGELKKLPCRVCGAPKTVAHHDDYAKPLAVMWLCRSHHMARHVSAPKKFKEWKVISSHKGKQYLSGSLEKGTYEALIKIAKKHSLTKSQAIEYACLSCLENSKTKTLKILARMRP